MNVKSKYLILFILILSGSLIGLIVLKTHFSSKTEVYEASIYKFNEGYGYRISFNNKLIIKQDIIPYIQTNQPFCNYNDAQKVANVVKEKLKNKENPNISLQELISLDIELKCTH